MIIKEFLLLIQIKDNIKKFIIIYVFYLTNSTRLLTIIK